MIRILLVDDQKLIRQGLKALLELDPEIDVVGSASDGQAAIEQVGILNPEIALIDIRMPGMDGVTATRIISERYPETKVIVLSGYDDEEYLAEALRSGAKGYLLKDTPAEELVNVIRAVHKGYAQIGPGLLEKISGKITGRNGGERLSSMPILPQTVAPLESKVLSLWQRQVEQQLDHFDPKSLAEVIRLALNRNWVEELLAYVKQQLWEKPQNLAALYLAGVLSTQSHPPDRTAALRHLSVGFQAGIEQELPSESLLSFYQAGVNVDPATAFNWLAHPHAPWNQNQDLSFLLAEASRLFGTSSQPYRTLLVLKQIRDLRAISENCNALDGKIASLGQTLAQLDNLFKA
jgi:DNA-binding NarL/FixJ family response regulator